MVHQTDDSAKVFLLGFACMGQRRVCELGTWGEEGGEHPYLVDGPRHLPKLSISW